MNERLDPSVLLAALAGTSLYVDLMPSLSEVRQASTSSATARDVRTGIVAGSAALLGSGVIMSFIAGDARPLMLSVVIAAMMGIIFEVVLQQPGEGGNNASAI